MRLMNSGRTFDSSIAVVIEDAVRMRIERVDGVTRPRYHCDPALEARLDAVVDLERLARLLHLPRRRRPPHNRRPLGLRRRRRRRRRRSPSLRSASRRAPRGASSSASRSASVRYAPPVRARSRQALEVLDELGPRPQHVLVRSVVVLAGLVVTAREGGPVRRCRSTPGLPTVLAAAEAGAREPAAHAHDAFLIPDRRQQIRADRDPRRRRRRDVRLRWRRRRGG